MHHCFYVDLSKGLGYSFKTEGAGANMDADRFENKIVRLSDHVDSKLDRVEARFDRLDSKLDKISDTLIDVNTRLVRMEAKLAALTWLASLGAAVSAYIHFFK